MAKTSSDKPTDLGFEVQIESGGRAHDASAPAQPTASPSPTRAAAKARSRRRVLLVVVACVALLAALGLWAYISNPNTNVPSDAVARVNGEYIYARDVDREVELSKASVELSK